MKLSMRSAFTNQFDKIFFVLLDDVNCGRVTIEKITGRVDPVIYYYTKDSTLSLEPTTDKSVTTMSQSYKYTFSADGVYIGTIFNTSRALSFLNYLNYTEARQGPVVYRMYRIVNDSDVHYMLYNDSESEQLGEIVMSMISTKLQYDIYSDKEEFFDLLVMLAAHSYVWEIRGGYNTRVSKKAVEYVSQLYTPGFLSRC